MSEKEFLKTRNIEKICYYLNIDKNTLEKVMEEHPIDFIPIKAFLDGHQTLDREYLDQLKNIHFHELLIIYNLKKGKIVKPKKRYNLWQTLFFLVPVIIMIIVVVLLL